MKILKTFDKPDWATFGEPFDATSLWHDFDLSSTENAECLAYYDIEFQERWNGQVIGCAYITGAVIEEGAVSFLDRARLMAQYGTPFIDAVEEAIDASRMGLA